MTTLKLFVRRALSTGVRCTLRARSQVFPLDAAAITLIIAPHQDDETLGCGGVIPLMHEAGNHVHITYVTDGSGSHAGVPDLASRRRKEALAATALLGVSQDCLEFLNATDGSLAWIDDNASAVIVDQLISTLNRVQPTLVLLPCRADGSSEHAATFTLFSRALAATGLHPRVFEFPIWSWWNPLLLRQPIRTSRHVWRAAFPGHIARKQNALATYSTQVQPLTPDSGPMLTPEFLSFFTAGEEFFFEF